MRFTQIIDFRTSRLDEMLALQRQWEEEATNSPINVDVQLCQDREDPQHCMVIATFDSYEDAMMNNDRPETSRNSEMMGKLADGPPRFVNLDVRAENMDSMA